MANLISTGVTILSLLLFLFQAFRRLRQDYSEEEVVKASILGLLIGAPGCFLVEGIDADFFIALLVVVLVVYLFSLRFKWHFWATLEALTSAGLGAVLLTQLSKLAFKFSFFELTRTGAYLVAFLSGFYWRNYRRFSWYPSGKSGFFFLASLATLALLMIPLDFWQKRLLELGVWVGLLTVDVAIVLLLSERKKVEKLTIEQGG